MLSKPHGFTLIEIMIVVSIMAILTLIAVPQYQKHVAKSHRRAVQLKMLELAMLLEKNPGQTPSLRHTLPYSIHIDRPSPEHYLITAVAKQPQTDPECARLVLESNADLEVRCQP